MKLTIYRGIPGSGKSTQAYKENDIVVEADVFFILDNDEYVYDISKSSDAHMLCRGIVCKHLYSKKNVAVANTFINQEQIDPYIDIAERYGAKIEVVECSGSFKSIHNVPDSIIEKMKNAWEDVVIPDNLKY